MRRLAGSHVPNIKNRSSKHLTWLTKFKSIFRSMSNAKLAEYSCLAAKRERQRREKKHIAADAKV